MSKGFVALVDDEDFDWLSGFNWHVLISQAKKQYAVTGHNTNSMARIIMRCPKGMVVDHIDGDSLNNQKYNLRICTPEQNSLNRKPRKSRISKYKGIQKVNDTWRVRIQFGNERLHIGYFKSDLEAAKAYDDAARRYYGEFAYLNFPNEVGPFPSWRKA